MDVFDAVIATWVFIWPYCCQIMSDPTRIMDLAWCVVICVKCGRVVVIRWLFGCVVVICG